MNIKSVWAVWFSGTGTTEKTVRRIADGLAAALKAERKNFNFTPPEARQQERTFSQEDLVVFGTPVYAGRVPNVLLPYLTGKIRGGGALAVPVAAAWASKLDGRSCVGFAAFTVSVTLPPDAFVPEDAF